MFSVYRWVYGDNYCTTLPRQFFNSASSLRFTGAPDDMHFDTVNFYAGEQVAVFIRVSLYTQNRI